MNKKIIALMLTAAMALGCTCAAGETARHERVYVVADPEGNVKSVTDSIRLENPDEAAELTDRTGLKEIRNAGGKETFTLDGETITWKAEGKSITYQGTSDKTPAVLPVVTLTLDGEKISAAELKEKTGEAVLTVTYKTEGQAPALAVSALPLPEEGISSLKTENATVLTEMDRPVLVGWAVPNSDEALHLPVSFSASFHADHADLGWMMTVSTSDPLAAACREITTKIGDTDLSAEMDGLTQVLTALLMGQEMPATEGKLKPVTDKLNELNKGLKDLDDGALQVSAGAKELADGASALNTGLDTLKKNNEALNSGATQIFNSILAAANEKIAASGLAEAGITLPALTAENYAEVLKGAAEQLNPEALKAAAEARVEAEVRKQVAANEDKIREGVQEAAKAKVLEAVLKAAGFEMTAEKYAAALKTGLVKEEQAAKVNAAVEAQMQSKEVLDQVEAAVKEKTEELVKENTEAYLAKDPTVAEKLAQAQAAGEQLNALKEQLDQMNTFVTGLKTYTEGVDQAADGAKKVSDGAAALSAGAAALQESGTKTLKDSLTTAERNAAMMLLPVVQSYGADALKAWNSLQETLADTGYDLRTEGTVTDTAYIIRTDLK